MEAIRQNLETTKKSIEEARALSTYGQSVKLIAVSKTKPIELLEEAYDQGVRAFGENKVQEIVEKQPYLPNDIQWHLIGHLQTNKVKQVLPYVSLIHSVDSEKLLKEIESEAKKQNRKINILLQVKIAEEDTKFGLDPSVILIILYPSFSQNFLAKIFCSATPILSL